LTERYILEISKILYKYFVKSIRKTELAKNICSK
jgi:hypothetical protein